MRQNRQMNAQKPGTRYELQLSNIDGEISLFYTLSAASDQDAIGAAGTIPRSDTQSLAVLKDGVCIYTAAGPVQAVSTDGLSSGFLIMKAPHKKFAHASAVGVAKPVTDPQCSDFDTSSQ